PSKMATIPPNQTLYVHNINDQIKKTELRRSLYCLFTQHGRVVDVVALKTAKMRGQAFIVFREIAAATAAMRALQGFPFYDSPLKIAYAKSKSNAIKLREGAYSAPRRTPGAAAEPGGAKDDEVEAGAVRKKRDEEAMDMDEDGEFLFSEPEPTGANPPNVLLFLKNLPTTVTEDMLAMLFQQYPGFKEIRLVPGKSVAFVEYETDAQADTAKTVLHGFKITPTNVMEVEFAKK
ncbi:hypothetical protein BDK51DRAFT_20045, partial [Blyttiomyces helicus]